MLPPADTVVVVTKLVFIINLWCSYALCIYPTNSIIEGWLHIKDKQSPAHYFLQNINRALVAISACYLGVALADKIDKFLGLMGAILCAPLALLFPAAVHLSLLAKTPRQKI
jgi:hypothetical protein